jgi:hypothetical protein
MTIYVPFATHTRLRLTTAAGQEPVVEVALL